MNSQVATLPHGTFIRARRRIQIALAILEDGMCFDLLAPEDVIRLLSDALNDLDEVHVVEGVSSQQSAGLDWNSYQEFASE